MLLLLLYAGFAFRRFEIPTVILCTLPHSNPPSSYPRGYLACRLKIWDFTFHSRWSFDRRAYPAQSLENKKYRENKGRARRVITSTRISRAARSRRLSSPAWASHELYPRTSDKRALISITIIFTGDRHIPGTLHLVGTE